MANRYVTITEVEKVNSLETTDNVFVNNNGTLKQASINDILASTTIGTQVTALESEVDTLQSDVTSVTDRVATAESEIDTLQSDIIELNSNLNDKSNSDHNHDGIYTTPDELNTAKSDVLELANTYTDKAVSTYKSYSPTVNDNNCTATNIRVHKFGALKYLRILNVKLLSSLANATTVQIAKIEDEEFMPISTTAQHNAIIANKNCLARLQVEADGRIRITNLGDAIPTSSQFSGQITYI